MTREETIYELGEWLEQMIQHGVPSYSAKRKALATAIALLSAEAVTQSEQYRKGFEDAKRAFLVEYARESKNMWKRNAELEVMLNAYRAIAEAKWIPCRERLPEDGTTVITFDSMGDIEFGSYENGEWYWLAEACADYWTRNSGVLAWMPLPKPYRGEQIDSNT